MPASHGFQPIRTADADLTRVQQEIASALDRLAAQVTAAAAWQGMTFNTHDDLRLQPGDPNGVKGPRAAIVAGDNQAKDGGEGTYVWDAASTADDNNTTVIQCNRQTMGRWRKV